MEDAGEVLVARAADLRQDGRGAIDLCAVVVGVLGSERADLHRAVEPALRENRVCVRGRSDRGGHGGDRGGERGREREPHRRCRGSTAKSREKPCISSRPPFPETGT